MQRHHHIARGFSPFRTRSPLSAADGALPTFDPATLFASGEEGVWYDPSDLSTMFQDVAASTAVASDGDPVARINDKSGNGYNALQSTDTQRPLYKAGSGLHWLQPDGVDDGFDISTMSISPPSGTDTWSSCFAVDSNSDAQYSYLVDAVNNSRFGLSAVSGSSDTTLMGSGGALNGIRIDGAAAAPATRGALHTLLAGRHIVMTEFTVPSAASWANPRLFNYPASATFRFSGFAYSILLINRALTAGETANLEAYMAAKSGVTL